MARVLRRLLARFEPDASLRPARGPLGAPAEGALAIRWLGTAAHRLRFAGESLLLDPFVSRTPLRALLRPLRSDPDAVARWAPEACAIAVGHSHYDHLLDAASIAARTGAVLLGSPSVARVARAAGVEEARLRVARGGALEERVGPFEVRLVPSVHARLVFGIAPPFPGEIERVPPRGLYVHQYRVGGASGIFVRAGGVTVYHNGSADLIDAALEGTTADVLLVGLAGRGWCKGYLERLVRILRPRVIVPTHYDAFFWPLEEGVRLLPRIGMDAFFEEARRLAPGAIVAAPSPFEDLLVDEGGRRVAVVPAAAP